MVASQLYSPVPHIPPKAQRRAQATVPGKWSLTHRLDRAGGSFAHSCLPPSAGGCPGDHLLSKGRMAEPQAGAVCGGRPSPLSIKSSQLQLGAPVQAVEDLGAQASLSKDSPQVPCLPRFLGCPAPPVRLQGREDSTPKLPIHAVSLAEGRGESPFLRFLHLDIWKGKLSSGSLPRGTPGCPASLRHARPSLRLFPLPPAAQCS